MKCILIKQALERQWHFSENKKSVGRNFEPRSFEGRRRRQQGPQKSLALFCLIGLFSTAFGMAAPQKKLALQTVSPVAPATFLALSDIHFDPFLSCSWFHRPCPLIAKLQAADPAQWSLLLAQDKQASSLSTYKQDSSYALLNSTFSAAQQETEKNSTPLQFVIVLGDFLGHGYKKKYERFALKPTPLGYQQFVYKTMTFLMHELRIHFPNTLLYPVIGNNDSYSEDYKTVVNGPFFHGMATVWDAPSLHAVQASTFTAAGYYSVRLPPTQNRLVILNSVLFSKKSVESADTKNAATLQLTWLAAALREARQQHYHVVLIAHIPPGIDSYSPKYLVFGMVVPFWKPVWQQQFMKLLAQYPDVIQALLTSHMHRDGFSILNATTPDFFVPAISPIFHNNPAFKIFTYTPHDLQLSNYAVYHLPFSKTLPQPSWALEYRFNDVYGKSCKNKDAKDPCPAVLEMQQLRFDPDLLKKYQLYANAQADSWLQHVEHKTARTLWCLIGNADEEGYRRCLVNG